MYCTNCGRKLSNERFCPVCGTENFELYNENNNSEATGNTDYYEQQRPVGNYRNDTSMGQAREEFTRFEKYRNMVSPDLCCPNCGNEYLQMTVETQVTTTGSSYSAGKGCLGYLLFGPLGLLCGGCGQSQHTTSTNKTFCVCSACGNKFRNPDETKKEIRDEKKIASSLTITTVVLTTLCLIFGAIVMSTTDISFMFVLGIIFPIIMGISIIIIKAATARKENELDELYTRITEWKSRRG